MLPAVLNRRTTELASVLSPPPDVVQGGRVELASGGDENDTDAAVKAHHSLHSARFMTVDCLAFGRFRRRRQWGVRVSVAALVEVSVVDEIEVVLALSDLSWCQVLPPARLDLTVGSPRDTSTEAKER